VSFLKIGFQTTEQYSSPGRTYVVKALTRLSMSRERKHFTIKFASLWPLVAYLLMCCENLSPLSILTPKSSVYSGQHITLQTVHNIR